MEPLRARRPINRPQKEPDNLWVWICTIGPFVLIAIVGGSLLMERLEKQHTEAMARAKIEAVEERQKAEQELAKERERRLSEPHPNVSQAQANRSAAAAVNRYYNNRPVPTARPLTAKERYERASEIYRSMTPTQRPSTSTRSAGSATGFQDGVKTATNQWECDGLARQKDRIEKLMRENRYGNGQNLRDRLNHIWGRMVELGCAR